MKRNLNGKFINDKNAEEALRKSEANLRAIFNHIGYALVLLDTSFIILSYNNVAQSWGKLVFGFNIEEGENILSLISKNRQIAHCDILNAIRLGRSYDQEISYTLDEGSIEWYRVRINQVYDEGEFVGLCISAANITPRKMAETEKIKITNDLIQHNKDLEQFAYIVSHNIRAPVANMIGLAEELNYDSHAEEVKKMFKRELVLSAKRLDNILIDLNDILKAKREINEKKQIIHLPNLVFSIQASIKNLIIKEGVTISTDFTDVSEFATLTSYMHSIFFNLITNSIKYRHPERPVMIFIKSTKAGSRVIISFKDNGTGIDLGRRKDQVFGLYKRFHPHIEGKGIGLFMVKTQVDTLGGSISVDSAINKGSEFKIELPLS